MKKSIILEGPNGSGKSTLAIDLMRDLCLPLSHSGPNPGNTAEAFHACSQQMEKIRHGYIIDRVTPISRTVYDHDCMPVTESIVLSKRLEEMLEKAIVIYCTAIGDFTDKPYYPEGHHDKITDERELIYSLYQDLMQGIPCISYNWETDSYESLLEKIYE